MWRLMKYVFLRFDGFKNNPVLWRGERIQFVKFGLFSGIGAGTATACILIFLGKKGYIIQGHDLIYFLFVPVIMWLGGRTTHLLVLGKKFFNDPRKYLLETGLYNQGAGICVIFYFFCIAYQLRIPVNIFLDALALGSVLGEAIGRIGCYNYGCCWGKPTTAEYGICHYDPLNKMLRLHPELKGVPVYPTQLMTAMSDLMLFFVAVGLYLLSAPNGIIFIVLVLAHQSFRLMIEPYRFDQFFDNQRKNHTIYFALLILLFIPIPLMLGSWLHWIDFFTTAAHPGYSLSQIVGQSNFWFITFYVFILTSLLYGLHGTRLGSIALFRERV